MRKIKEVLRLHNEAKLSERSIARSVSLSRDTVSRILIRAAEQGLAWPLPVDMDDVQLETLHVEAGKSFYSGPYQLVGQKLDVRLTQNIVEIFHNGRRIASHCRAHGKGQYVTDASHRPKSH